MLPHVDDGAYDTAEMKKMIELAYSDGIRTICFTPHFKLNEFRDESDIEGYNQHIEKMFALANDHVASAYPDMKLYLGSEIMCHSDISESISSLFCRHLANTSYVLIEFMPKSSFFDIKNTVLKLTRKGIRPILAHAERYLELVKSPEHISELKEYGCLIQINAISISKIRHGKVARFIKHLLKHSLVDIVATDAHDTKHRTPILSSAFEKICKSYGEERAAKLFADIPNAILNNEKEF
jgi:protein-tyrosine phosphatase